MSVAIGFSTRPFNPLSWFIRRMTGSRCSHAWLLVDEPFFRIPMVLEATEWGVRLIDANIFWHRNQIVRVYKTTLDLTNAVRDLGYAIGEMYDFSGAIGLSFVTFALKWLHRKLRNPLQDPHGMFCSELVMTAMKRGGYSGLEKYLPETTSPEAIFELLEERKEVYLDCPKTPALCLTLPA